MEVAFKIVSLCIAQTTLLCCDLQPGAALFFAAALD
jgi:hypothetical protein